MPVCLLYKKSVAFCASVSLFMLLCRPPLPLGQQYGILTHSNAFLPPVYPWLRRAYNSLSAVVLPVCIILYLLLSVSVLGRVRPEVYCFPETMHYRVLFL